MVTVLALLGVVLVLFVAAVVATREDQAMADVAQDLPDLALPVGPLEPQDVATVRFSMAPRGYRMSEVDAVLERLAEELADRDRQLAELADLVGLADADLADVHLADAHLADAHLADAERADTDRGAER